MSDSAQTWLRDAFEAGQQAATACTAKAERIADFDTEGARKAVLGLLARHGPMSGEDLTDKLKELGFRPHLDKAFGSVYGVLARRGDIKCVGYRERRKGHGTGGAKVWSLPLSFAGWALSPAEL